MKGSNRLEGLSWTVLWSNHVIDAVISITWCSGLRQSHRHLEIYCRLNNAMRDKHNTLSCLNMNMKNCKMIFQTVESYVHCDGFIMLETGILHSQLHIYAVNYPSDPVWQFCYYVTVHMFAASLTELLLATQQ